MVPANADCKTFSKSFGKSKASRRLASAVESANADWEQIARDAVASTVREMLSLPGAHWVYVSLTEGAHSLDAELNAQWKVKIQSEYGGITAEAKGETLASAKAQATADWHDKRGRVEVKQDEYAEFQAWKANKSSSGGATNGAVGQGLPTAQARHADADDGSPSMLPERFDEMTGPLEGGAA